MMANYWLRQHDPAKFAAKHPTLEPFLQSHTEAACEHYVTQFEAYLARAEESAVWGAMTR